MKRYQLWLGSLCLLLLGCATEQTKQPNILFLFADDQTYTAVHAFGNSEIETPNLDRLVQNGTTFTHAYNMGGWNGAICVASRAMIISGRSLWRANAFRQNWIDEQELDKTWGRLMEQQGYQTYMTGKWHVDAPSDSVFQVVRHERPGMPPDAWILGNMGKRFADLRAGKYDSLAQILPVGYNRPLSPTDDSWSPTDTSFGGFWGGGQHWSEVVRDDALLFLDSTQQSEKPFFMYLAFNAPHDPRQAPQEYLNKYPLDEMSLPESWLPEYPYKDSIGCDPGLRDEALAPFPRTPLAIKTHQREYYALVSHLDAQIGKILDALEASGELDNTYIFFTADHGLSVGRHGLLGKQNMYDHSVRVPFMVVGPGVPKGQRVDADIYLQDVMATALDLAKAEKPDYIEFHSLLPFLDGSQTQSNHEAIYGAYVDLQRMIRKDGYKLIVYPKVPKVLLFDLKNDPHEMHNLAEAPEQAERIQNLFLELQELQHKMGDTLDLSGFDLALAKKVQ